MKVIIKYLAFSMLTILAFACNTSESNSSDTVEAGMSDNTNKEVSDNILTKSQQDDGWKLLFDGKSLEGWHTFNKEKAGPNWIAKDGKLVFDPETSDQGGDLLTDAEFENYHLKLDWKISECGNSGIIFNVQEGNEKTYHTGPEMQILDNSCHPDAKIVTHRAGDLYDLITATPETVNPAGEWNTAEIKLNDGQLTFYLNGTKVVETEMFTDKWAEMLADSKFKQWEDKGFGTFRKGHLALQDHGNYVEFKNIMIKEL